MLMLILLIMTTMMMMTILPTHSRALDSCFQSSFVALYMNTLYVFKILHEHTEQPHRQHEMISCDIYIDKPLGLLMVPFSDCITTLVLSTACFSLPRSAISKRKARKQVSQDIF